MNKFEGYCISLPQEQKLRLIGLLRKSLQPCPPGKTFELMHDAMVKVLGKEVLVKSRERNLVIGRTILAYSCACLGWTEHTIAKCLQRDHASINIMKKNMRNWIKFPNVFKKENDLYVEFLKEWDNETDR